MKIHCTLVARMNSCLLRSCSYYISNQFHYLSNYILVINFFTQTPLRACNVGCFLFSLPLFFSWPPLLRHHTHTISPIKNTYIYFIQKYMWCCFQYTLQNVYICTLTQYWFPLWMAYSSCKWLSLVIIILFSMFYVKMKKNVWIHVVW